MSISGFVEKISLKKSIKFVIGLYLNIGIISKITSDLNNIGDIKKIKGNIILIKFSKSSKNTQRLDITVDKNNPALIIKII